MPQKPSLDFTHDNGIHGCSNLPDDRDATESLLDQPLEEAQRFASHLDALVLEKDLATALQNLSNQLEKMRKTITERGRSKIRVLDDELTRQPTNIGSDRPNKQGQEPNGDRRALQGRTLRPVGNGI